MKLLEQKECTPLIPPYFSRRDFYEPGPQVSESLGRPGSKKIWQWRARLAGYAKAFECPAWLKGAWPKFSAARNGAARRLS